ncbi:manganese catalase family protein [Jannaschia sp. W003]|uniref:manganese catalase family protein n=1 Tax=Jannaschia sp. W003 TaxID=2867012 RepID=UPI0021A89FF7|nr:manganese catalase family protein [Jannaschia sp. W003]UWQ20427.1 manganese catalase family protein [Jannaschia sp. W003]
MFYHSGKLQYEVRVDNPDPVFAKYLQQAIGGVEGEIRVAMQYMFQAMGARGDSKYRDMLMMTATEELSHIEFLGHAVALNLQNAPLDAQEAAATDPVVGAIMGGMNPRHVLSSGLSAMPVNANGVPFDMSHVYATGNIGADMLANATAESGGRVLASRLYNMTDDKGMKDMLSFLIARDTMHQQQWLAVIEDLGGIEACMPVPNSTPESHEAMEHSYYFLNTSIDEETPQGVWTNGGKAMDGRGTYTAKDKAEPMGQVPDLGKARPKSGAQKEQM